MPSKLVTRKERTARKGGWKDIQSKKRKEKRTKLALMVLGLVVILILLSQIVHFTQTLFSPWKLSTKSHRNYVWNGEFNINLLVHTKSVSLISYNPYQKKVTVINIPDETYLEVPHGFGQWQLRAIYGLGGNKLLKDTLVSFFGIPIDGFLDLSPPFDQKEAGELVETWRSNPFSGFNLLPSLQTDLTLWELIRLKINLSSIRFDKKSEWNLLEVNVLEKINLLDGTQVFVTDPVKLDSYLADLADPTIISEHKSIAIFNATNHPQLAQKAARLITNLGGNVIITSNAPLRLKRSQLMGEQSATLKRLRQIFDTDDKISASKDTGSSRAQINLFLGEDSQR